MELLRHGGIRPCWRAVARGELEGQARRYVVGGDDHPVVALVGDRLPEQPGVERRQGGRVGAVEHHMVQVSEHPVSMTGAVRAWCRGRIDPALLPAGCLLIWWVMRSAACASTWWRALPGVRAGRSPLSWPGAASSAMRPATAA